MFGWNLSLAGSVRSFRAFLKTLLNALPASMTFTRASSVTVPSNVELGPELVVTGNPAFDSITGYVNNGGLSAPFEIVPWQGAGNTLHVVGGTNSGTSAGAIMTIDKHYSLVARVWVVSGSMYFGISTDKIGGTIAPTGAWQDIVVPDYIASQSNMRIYSAVVGSEWYLDSISLKEVIPAVLVTVGNNVPAFEGLRLSYNLAEGATLGAELAAPTDLTLWTPSAATVNDLNTFTTAAAGGVQKVLLTAGRFYSIAFSASSTTTFNLKSSNAAGITDSFATVGGTYTFVAAGTSLYMRNTAAGTTDFAITELKEVIPVWLTTAIDGITPLVSQGALNEPAGTNKVTCAKVNPTVLTNLTKSGDVNATLAVVQSVAALAAGGLANVCTNGNVYRVDNNIASAGAAYVQFSPSVGNTNPHSARVYIRLVSGVGPVRMGWASTVGSDFGSTSSSTFVPISGLGVIPATSGQYMCISIPMGCIVEFILPELVESPFLTSPIPGSGALTTETRAASVFSSTGIPSGAPWIFEVKWKSKLNSAQIVTPQTLFCNYTDANNYVCLRLNSVIAYLEKVVAGVKEYVTIPATVVAGLNYSILVRRNADGTFDLFLGGVKSLSGLGAEMLTTAQQQFDSGWSTVGESTVSGGVGRVLSTAGAGSTLTATGAGPVTGKVYRPSYVVSGTPSGQIKELSGNVLPTVVGANTLSYVHNATSTFLFSRVGVCDVTLDSASLKEVYNSTTATQPVTTPAYNIGSDGLGANQLYAGILAAGHKSGVFSDSICQSLTV